MGHARGREGHNACEQPHAMGGFENVRNRGGAKGEPVANLEQTDFSPFSELSLARATTASFLCSGPGGGSEWGVGGRRRNAQFCSHDMDTHGIKLGRSKLEPPHPLSSRCRAG
jgi:hypothetical protein